MITGWSALTDGRCHVIDLPGDHSNVLSVNNSAMAAAKLKPHLSLHSRSKLRGPNR